jgi:tRNA isopentenyl-2-thiomethyl-A-37 hydroxylase MiaE
VDLAREHAGREDVDARLAVLADAEAKIVAELPLLPRIH